MTTIATTGFNVTENPNTQYRWTVFTGSAAQSVTLPSADIDPGRAFTFVNLGTGTVTINAPAGGLINGSATYSLSSQYSKVTVVGVGGTQWVIVA